jgi:hypothetical protein
MNQLPSIIQESIIKYIDNNKDKIKVYESIENPDFKLYLSDVYIGDCEFNTIEQYLKKGYYMNFCDMSLNYILYHSVLKQYINQIYDWQLNIETIYNYTKFLTNDNFNKYLDKIYCVRIRDEYIDPLPDFSMFKNLKKMKFDYYFNKSIDNLPDTVEHIELNWEFNTPINKLPTNLKEITFGNFYNQPLTCLPEGLTSLRICKHFNQPLNKYNIPRTLKHLYIGRNFNHKFEPGDLPEGLITLSFIKNSKYSHNLEGVLPKSIKTLKLGDKYKKLYH